MENKRYKVHRFEIKGDDIYLKLEKFINSLKGEIISILPNIKKGRLPQFYGVTGKVDNLIIVELLK